jgi:hypothetical protein
MCTRHSTARLNHPLHATTLAAGSDQPTDR